MQNGREIIGDTSLVEAMLDSEGGMNLCLSCEMCSSSNNKLCGTMPFLSRW